MFELTITSTPTYADGDTHTFTPRNDDGTCFLAEALKIAATNIEVVRRGELMIVGVRNTAFNEATIDLAWHPEDEDDPIRIVASARIVWGGPWPLVTQVQR